MHPWSIYHSTVFNSPERGRYHLHRGGSLIPDIYIGLLLVAYFVFCIKIKNHEEIDNLNKPFRMILFHVDEISTLRNLELYNPELDKRRGCTFKY